MYRFARRKRARVHAHTCPARHHARAAPSWRSHHTTAQIDRRAETSPHTDFAYTRYCHYQYSMLNGNTGGAGGNHISRNIEYKIQRGGVVKEVLNAKNSID